MTNLEGRVAIVTGEAEGWDPRTRWSSTDKAPRSWSTTSASEYTPSASPVAW